MKNKKYLLLSSLFTPFIALPIIGSTVSCSLFKSPPMEFWNYEDYMDEDIQKDVEKAFIYSEFGDLPEFRQALIDETASGGVGSDYFNAQLAKDGYIQKIDFSRFFELSSSKNNWASELQKIYTPEAWKLMSSFDSFFIENKIDNDNDGVIDQLWEYMVPYFIQNKVIGVNLDRIKNFQNTPSNVKDTDKDGFTISQPDFEALFPNKSYKGILDTLRGWGASKLAINDYMRDNMMIGSEINGNFTGKVNTIDEGKTQINNFINQTISGWKSTFATSGVNNLNNLLIDSVGEAQVGLMYNGDALYANQGAGITDEKTGEATLSNRIRIVTPENPTFLLDGLVISSSLKENKSEMDRFYDNIPKFLFEGVNEDIITNYPKDGILANDSDEVKEQKQAKFEEAEAAYKDQIRVYKNFDFVNYTPAYKNVHDYVENGYFDGNENGKHMALTVKNSSGKIDANHITSPISPNLTIQLETYYSNKKR